jgi:hypothetical protein
MSLLGNRAIRLMRENWRTPRALAEELYAIFSAKEPVELEDTLTIRVPEGRPALRVARREERPDDRPAPTPRPPARQRPEGPTQGPGVRTTNRVTDDGAPQPRPQPTADPYMPRRRTAEPRREGAGRPGQQERPASAPLIEIDGPVSFAGREPVRFETPPVFVDRATGNETTIEKLVEESLASRLALLGFGSDARLVAARIIEGTSNARDYWAEIYENGPDEPPLLDQGGRPQVLPLRIIYLHEQARLLPGTVVFPVTRGKEFYVGQVPVWME